MAATSDDYSKARAAEGKWYSLTSELFNIRVVESHEGGYEEIASIRANKPNKFSRRILFELGLVPDPKSGSRKGSEQTNPQPYSQPGERKPDLFGALNGEDAHQIPKSPTCYGPYAALIPAVMGIDLESQPLDKLLQAANIAAEKVGGSRVGRVAMEGNRELYVKTILEYLVRIVRDSPINLLRMPSPHGDVYDRFPTLITIPCISQQGNKGLEWIKNWGAPQEYWILIFAKNAATYEAMIGAKAMNHNGQPDGCTASLASALEIRESCSLLKAMVKAQAELLVMGKPQRFAGTNVGELTTVAETLANGQVQVPNPSVGGKVLKIKLDNSKYQIPDPMLVLVKGAINWYYVMTKKKLLPACKEGSDLQEKEEQARLSEELRTHALELYEEALQEEFRPDSWEDLAKGLGQSAPEPRRVSYEPDEVQ